MSKRDLPPIPPAGRPPKGSDIEVAEHPSDLTRDAGSAARRNIDKQGRQGNINVNTRHPGHQQDR